MGWKADGMRTARSVDYTGKSREGGRNDSQSEESRNSGTLDRNGEGNLMPAKSAKQQRFMGMCSTDKGRAKAKGKCPPKKVAKEFARKKK